MRKTALILFIFIMVTGCNKADIFQEASSAPIVVRTNTPVTSISPNGNTFAVNETITITATNAPTAIYYRINISGGWSLWNTYAGAFAVSSSCIIEAYGVNTDGNGSIVSATFSKTGEKPTVSFSPIGGAFTTSVTVTISATNSPTSIEYSLNGGAWTTYTGPLTISSTSTLSAQAINGFGTGTAGPATYLIESFTPGAQNPIDFSGGFTVKSGTATITDMGDGTFRIVSSNGKIIYNPTDGKSNYIVSGEVQVNPVAGYAIMFRMQDNVLLQGYGFQYETALLRLVYFNESTGWSDASIMLATPDNLPNPVYDDADDPAGISVVNAGNTNWHTFAIIVNGNIIKVYLDGVLKYNTDTSTSVFFNTNWWNSTHATNYGIPSRWNTGGLGFRFWAAATIYARNWQYQDIN